MNDATEQRLVALEIKVELLERLVNNIMEALLKMAEAKPNEGR